MNQTIKDFFERWKSSLIWVGVFSVVWILAKSMEERETLGKLPWVDIVSYLLQVFAELIIFVILMKIIFATNAVVNNMGEIFSRVLFRREFFQSIEKSELKKISEDITRADKDYVFVDCEERNKAIEITKKVWEDMPGGNEKLNHIYIESNSTTTLYEKGQVIFHKKIRVLMMKTGIFKTDHGYIPYDKQVAEMEKIEEEDYYKNNPGDRWDGKSFKYRIIDNDIAPIVPKLSIQEEEDGRRYVQFDVESDEIIEKGTEFTIEYSISDIISLEKDAENNKRREEFFSESFTVGGLSSAIRNISFQLESYHDGDSHLLNFVPVIKFDDEDPVSLGSCTENIYYRKWTYQRYNNSKEQKKYTIKLSNARHNQAKCNSAT